MPFSVLQSGPATTPLSVLSQVQFSTAFHYVDQIDGLARVPTKLWLGVDWAPFAHFSACFFGVVHD